MVDYVNPGLRNPKRMFSCEGTIWVSDYDYGRSTPLIEKPCFFFTPAETLNHGINRKSSTKLGNMMVGLVNESKSHQVNGKCPSALILSC